jgi:hypothetical protein
LEVADGEGDRARLFEWAEAAGGLFLEVGGDLGELVEGGFEVLGDFEGDYGGIGLIGGVHGMGIRGGKAENLRETGCSKKMWEKSKAPGVRSGRKGRPPERKSLFALLPVDV